MQHTDNENKINQIKSDIDNAQKIAIFAHINPD
jgi:nanoRNase/pAp phosphatase (c-di-AMP/oligoRNAs hydrolase)